jgi:hypothetical protein
MITATSMPPAEAIKLNRFRLLLRSPEQVRGARIYPRTCRKQKQSAQRAIFYLANDGCSGASPFFPRWMESAFR